MTDLIKFPPHKGFKLEGHPPGGRCMVGRCYCGTCPDYEPLPRTEAPAAAVTTNNSLHAKSWADRTEETWMEKL